MLTCQSHDIDDRQLTDWNEELRERHEAIRRPNGPRNIRFRKSIDGLPTCFGIEFEAASGHVARDATLRLISLDYPRPGSLPAVPVVSSTRYSQSPSPWARQFLQSVERVAEEFPLSPLEAAAFQEVFGELNQLADEDPEALPLLLFRGFVAMSPASNAGQLPEHTRRICRNLLVADTIDRQFPREFNEEGKPPDSPSSKHAWWFPW